MNYLIAQSYLPGKVVQGTALGTPMPYSHNEIGTCMVGGGRVAHQQPNTCARY